MLIQIALGCRSKVALHCGMIMNYGDLFFLFMLIRGLDYFISHLSISLKEKKELQLHVESLLVARKAIGITFDGIGNGIAYDEETRGFFMAEVLKGRNKNEMASAIE